MHNGLASSSSHGSTKERKSWRTKVTAWEDLPDHVVNSVYSIFCLSNVLFAFTLAHLCPALSFPLTPFPVSPSPSRQASACCLSSFPGPPSPSTLSGTLALHNPFSSISLRERSSHARRLPHGLDFCELRLLATQAIQGTNSASTISQPPLRMIISCRMISFAKNIMGVESLKHWTRSIRHRSGSILLGQPSN